AAARAHGGVSAVLPAARTGRHRGLAGPASAGRTDQFRHLRAKMSVPLRIWRALALVLSFDLAGARAMADATAVVPPPPAVKHQSTEGEGLINLGGTL